MFANLFFLLYICCTNRTLWRLIVTISDMKHLCPLIVLAASACCLPASAYDMTVIFRVDETNQKTVEFAPSLFNVGLNELLASPTLNEADTTFVFKEAPVAPFMLMYNVDNTWNGRTIKQQTDTLTIYIPAFYVKKPEALKELTVTASDRSMSAEKETYIPTSQNKRISADGTQLIQNTGITTLNVSSFDGTISTLSGEPVSTFIDFRPASRTDVRNIRAEEVKRIDVYDFPTDPRFGGARHVVNFVMVQYEFGGYTKINADQLTVMNNGQYGAYSKLAYKKMIYDVGVDFDYTNNKHERIVQQSEFVFPDKTVSYVEETKNSLEKNHNVSAFLRAVYSTKKTVLTNTFSLRYRKSPHNYSEAEERFDVPEYTSGIDFSSEDRKSIGFSWSGNYQFTLPKKLMLVVEPKASYSKNDMDSRYSSGTASIVNIVDEKAWSAGLSVSLRKSLGKHSLTAKVYGNASGNNIDYQGTTPSYQKGRQIYGGAMLQGNFILGNLTLSPNVVVYADKLKINGVSETTVNPQYFVYASYFFSPKNRTQFSSMIYRQSAGQRNKTDFVQLQNQIFAIAGNPDLKNSTWLSASLQHTYMPTKAFTISPYMGFKYNRHAICYDYVPEVIGGRDVMVRKYVNAGNNTDFTYGVSMFYKLFDNALSLGANINGVTQNFHGPITDSGTYVVCHVDARYTFRDFYISALYQPGRRQISCDGVAHHRGFYYLKAGWGNGNLQLSVTAVRPFSSYRDSRYEINTRYYNTVTQEYSASSHSRFIFSATYSFSYGKKKVSKEIDTDLPTGPESQILK